MPRAPLAHIRGWSPASRNAALLPLARSAAGRAAAHRRLTADSSTRWSCAGSAAALVRRVHHSSTPPIAGPAERAALVEAADRKSTRLNSSHDQISYAVFCLKKKKKKKTDNKYKKKKKKKK